MQTPVPNTEMIQQFTTAINSFSLDLLRRLAVPGGNCFLSPYSVYKALCVLYYGAGVKSRAVIARALGLSDIEAERVAPLLSGLQASLDQPEPPDRSFIGLSKPKDEPAYELQLATSLWLQQQVAVEPDFRQVVEQEFGAETLSVDFSSAATVEQINQWVYEHTQGKIDRIIDQLDPRSLIVLLNAIYFRGEWMFPFTRERTAPDTFYLSDGRSKRLPMMHCEQAEDLAYAKTSELEIVRLPYRRGRIGMYILLPARHQQVGDVLDRLDLRRWADLRASIRESRGRVVLPRFELSYTVRLNDALLQLGLAPIFEPRTADFGRMIRGNVPVAIDEVSHSTRLEVNEAGTEAAATTSFVAVFGGMMRQPEPFRMIVDRPFLLLIEDAETGLILFNGLIADPDS